MDKFNVLYVFIHGVVFSFRKERNSDTTIQYMFGDLVLSEINESQKEQILCGFTNMGSQIHTDRK